MERQIQSNNDAKHVMWVGLMISVTFAIVFSVIVGFMVNKINDLAQENKTNAHQTCLKANIVRSEVIDVWEFFFTLNKNPTPDQQKDIDAGRAKIASVYKQQVCPS